jgi:hypothetical protein
LIGKKFGKLLVISLSDRIDNCLVWNCKCDCGTTKVIKGYSLRNGSTKSCGCLNAQHLARMKSDKTKKSNCVTCNSEFLHFYHSHDKCCSESCYIEYGIQYRKEYRHSNLKNKINSLFIRAMAKSKRQNLPCDITKDYLLELI